MQCQSQTARPIDCLLSASIWIRSDFVWQDRRLDDLCGVNVGRHEVGRVRRGLVLPRQPQPSAPPILHFWPEALKTRGLVFPVLFSACLVSVARRLTQPTPTLVEWAGL